MEVKTHIGVMPMPPAIIPIRLALVALGNTLNRKHLVGDILEEEKKMDRMLAIFVQSLFPPS